MVELPQYIFFINLEKNKEHQFLYLYKIIYDIDWKYGNIKFY